MGYSVHRVPAAGAYKHWGMHQPNNSPEPNNLNPPEDCVVGNFTEAFNGAWGWADVNCGLELPYICRVIRGCHCVCCTSPWVQLVWSPQHECGEARDLASV